MNKICEVCDKRNSLIKVLDLGRHPLCDDLLKINSKKENKLYKIKILYCRNCFTAHQKYQIPKKILFPNNYHYRSKLTKDVTMGMNEIVSQSQKFHRSLKNKTVLDVGCNDGSLLNFFKNKGSTTIGIEPTGAAFEARSNGHDVYKDYINKKVLLKIIKKYKYIDIITFTNVFAHIENLNLLIKNLNLIVSKDTLLIIENHYLGSILKKKQFDTFYHEHPRTYSLNSFLYISKKLKLNLNAVKFTRRYGGNIRIFLSRQKSKLNINKYLIDEKKFIKNFKKLNFFILKWKKNKLKLFNNLVKKYGPLTAKAFPGRAAILIQLLKLNTNHLSQVLEQKFSKKIGYYVPGTKIPILSDISMRNIDKSIPIINLAWHLKNEIRTYFKKKKIKNKIIDIISNKDFR
jgi:2-polyprenyl-3-methyl-5-hydroxy-6-metoxy-1,4-benzoquinol methylase